MEAIQKNTNNVGSWLQPFFVCYSNSQASPADKTDIPIRFEKKNRKHLYINALSIWRLAIIIVFIRQRNGSRKYDVISTVNYCRSVRKLHNGCPDCSVWTNVHCTWVNGNMAFSASLQLVSEFSRNQYCVSVMNERMCWDGKIEMGNRMGDKTNETDVYGNECAMCLCHCDSGWC